MVLGCRDIIDCILSLNWGYEGSLIIHQSNYMEQFLALFVEQYVQLCQNTNGCSPALWTYVVAIL